MGWSGAVAASVVVAARPPLAKGVPGKEKSRSRWVLGGMVGRSVAMERLFLQMRYLARPLRVASIEGEVGTGKLLAARTLHALAGLRASAFVYGDAAKLLAEPPEQAFAGATGGTLYLSGVERLGVEGRTRLLRLLEAMSRADAGRLPRALLVGSRKSLRSLVLQGEMRGDLYHLLSSVQLALPPLRERHEDIGVLCRNFLDTHGRPSLSLASGAQNLLYSYNWPGNVRELEAVLLRATGTCVGEWVRASDICFDPESKVEPLRAVRAVKERVAVRPSEVKMPQVMENAEAFDPDLDRAIVRHVRKVVESVEGNKLKAARLLGISRSTLYRLLDGEAGTSVESERKKPE